MHCCKLVMFQRLCNNTLFACCFSKYLGTNIFCWLLLHLMFTFTFAEELYISWTQMLLTYLVCFSPLTAAGWGAPYNYLWSTHSLQTLLDRKGTYIQRALYICYYCGYTVFFFTVVQISVIDMLVWSSDASLVFVWGANWRIMEIIGCNEPHALRNLLSATLTDTAVKSSENAAVCFLSTGIVQLAFELQTCPCGKASSVSRVHSPLDSCLQITYIRGYFSQHRGIR